jgi:hypothetical protein
MTIRGLAQRIRFIPPHIRRFIQRGRRGWSEMDAWSLDLYLARVMSESIGYLAENGHTYPGTDQWETPEKWQAHLRDLSQRLTRWNGDDSFLDEGAYQETVQAIRELCDVWGHLWD